MKKRRECVIAEVGNRPRTRLERKKPLRTE